MGINDQGVQYVENQPMEEIKEQLKEQLRNSATSPLREKTNKNNHPSTINPHTASLLHLFLQ